MIQFLFIGLAAKGQMLKRSGMGGFYPLPVSDSMAVQLQLPANDGLYIQNVGSKGTGANLGLQAGDVLLMINHVTVNEYRDFGKKEIQEIRAGDIITYTVYRNGKVLDLKGKVEEKPYEKSESHEVMYDHFEKDGGWVRTIINKPVKKGPVPGSFICSGIYLPERG